VVYHRILNESSDRNHGGPQLGRLGSGYRVAHKRSKTNAMKGTSTTKRAATTATTSILGRNRSVEPTVTLASWGREGS
jgi:hypothetical protein